jgi:hypothetical protein
MKNKPVIAQTSAKCEGICDTIADWQRKREEEVAREENFGDGRKGRKGKGGGDGGYHSKIQAKQMADIIRVDEQAAEQAREDFRMSEHDRTPVPVVKGETLSAMEKAKEAARQKALEDFRAGERDRTRVPVPAPKKEEKSWWGSLLDAGKGLLSAGTKAFNEKIVQPVLTSAYPRPTDF